MNLCALSPRSWLFVPADSNKKMMKALASGADAIIFDLEDSVAPAQKPIARELLTLLPERRDGEPERWVRVNPLGTDDHREDMELLEDLDIDGVVLPKAECGDDVADLAAELAPRALRIHSSDCSAIATAVLAWRQ
jgi:citrate lyase subunit beta/citryl-CoA lyase